MAPGSRPARASRARPRAASSGGRTGGPRWCSETLSAGPGSEARDPHRPGPWRRLRSNTSGRPGCRRIPPDGPPRGGERDGRRTPIHRAPAPPERAPRDAPAAGGGDGRRAGRHRGRRRRGVVAPDRRSPTTGDRAPVPTERNSTNACRRSGGRITQQRRRSTEVAAGPPARLTAVPFEGGRGAPPPAVRASARMRARGGAEG